MLILLRYCNALEAKARELERAIQCRREGTAPPPKEHDSQHESESRQSGITPYQVEPLQAPISYVGPASTASLLRTLLKGASDWHMRFKPETFDQTTKPLLQAASGRKNQQSSLLSFPTKIHQQNLDVASIVPPTTQKALLNHYLKVVQPQYPLLSPAQELAILEHENALRWASSASNHADNLITAAVLAISCLLVARDLDPSLSVVSIMCKDLFETVSSRQEGPPNSILCLQQKIVSL